MKSTRGLLRLLAVSFSLALGAVAESSTAPRLPPNIVNCIDVDLKEIEELVSYLKINIPLESLQDEAFGLSPRDWSRLEMLQKRLPSSSKLKSRLIKAFRILVYALYEAYGQNLYLNNETTGNVQSNSDPVYVQSTPQNNTYGNQAAGSHINEVVVPPQVETLPYKGTSGGQYRSTETDNASGHGSSEDQDDGVGDSEERSTQGTDEPQTDKNDLSNPEETSKPLPTTVPSTFDDNPTSRKITNLINDTTYGDDRTQQLPRTTINQSSDREASSTPVTTDSGIPDTTSTSSDTTNYSTNTDLPSDRPGPDNTGQTTSSTQEDISTEPSGRFNMFDVIFRQPENIPEETQELETLTIFPPSGFLVEQSDDNGVVRNPCPKSNCVNVGNLKFRNSVYSGMPVLNSVLHRQLEVINGDKDIDTALPGSHFWIHKINTLKRTH